ncbi:phage terminase large subunit family protein [Haloferula helveola]
MRSETNRWQVRCGACGATQPLWEAGGIRYKKTATASVSATIMACPNCGCLRDAVVERSDG